MSNVVPFPRPMTLLCANSSEHGVSVLTKFGQWVFFDKGNHWVYSNAEPFSSLLTVEDPWGAKIAQFPDSLAVLKGRPYVES